MKWNFWPLNKKKNTQLTLQQECLEASDMIREKWLVFSQLAFKEEVPLTDRNLMFMEPAMEGVLKAKPSLAALPTEVVMLVFANGIADAGTHSALEVQDALGIPRG